MPTFVPGLFHHGCVVLLDHFGGGVNVDSLPLVVWAALEGEADQIHQRWLDQILRAVEGNQFKSRETQRLSFVSRMWLFSQSSRSM